MINKVIFTSIIAISVFFAGCASEQINRLPSNIITDNSPLLDLPKGTILKLKNNLQVPNTDSMAIWFANGFLNANHTAKTGCYMTIISFGAQTNFPAKTEFKIINIEQGRPKENLKSVQMTFDSSKNLDIFYGISCRFFGNVTIEDFAKEIGNTFLIIIPKH